MLLPVVAYILFRATASGASAIYDAIGRFFGWQQMPKDSGGLFFGLPGCTRSALEYAIEYLRTNYTLGWYTSNSSSRSAIFNMLAGEVSAQTGADIQGIVKFCNWVYVACKGDTDILSFMAGGDYSGFKDMKKQVTEAISSTASEIAETVQYGMEYETEAESTINRLIPVIGILGACYLAKKILD